MAKWSNRNPNVHVLIIRNYTIIVMMESADRASWSIEVGDEWVDRGSAASVELAKQKATSCMRERAMKMLSALDEAESE